MVDLDRIVFSLCHVESITTSCEILMPTKNKKEKALN